MTIYRRTSRHSHKLRHPVWILGFAFVVAGVSILATGCSTRVSESTIEPALSPSESTSSFDDRGSPEAASADGSSEYGSSSDAPAGHGESEKDASTLSTGGYGDAEEGASLSSAAPAAEGISRDEFSPAREPGKAESKKAPKDTVDPAKLASMQGGVLTAGSFDDHRRFGAFQDFVAKSMQNDPYEQFPRLTYGKRVLIHVHNGQGEPIADTRVDIQPANSQSQQAAFSVRTGSDGRALFLTQKDTPGVYTDEYIVTVHPEQSAPIQKQVNVATGIWNIELTDGQLARPRQLDLALVIDATGSMGDEMNYLKIEIDHIAATVKQMFPNVDQRFALIVYRDHGDAFVTRTFDFTSSLGEFRERLSEQTANGGGDYPEAMDAAMQAASQLSWRRGNSARVMFLIGDAPPHDRDAKRTLAAANTLRKNNVRVFPIAASGSAWKAEFVLRTTAFLTMGEYLFLTDHSGVGNPHAKPHVPDYQVEHLNRMMVRMIAQELAGKKLAPAEVIAIERGDSSPLQFQPVQPVVLGNFHQSQTVNHVAHCLPPTPAPVAIVHIDWVAVKWMSYGLVICGAVLLGAYLNC